MQNYYVYVMTNKPNGVLYIGNTNDLVRRVWQHKNKYFKDCFTARYNLDKLVLLEHFEQKWDAADRERKLKNWKRQWKIDLIEKSNPEWLDLYYTITERDPDFRQDAL